MKYALLLLLLLIPFKVKAITADAYIVMDGNSGRVLEGKNIEEEKLIASTTKIMTCIIALENKDINTIVKVGPEVLKAYGSAIYINVGEEMSLKDLLYGLMLRSGNDAAIEIAYAVSGDMEKFVAKMNEKAYELGMSHTKFINNHGLENENKMGNTSTAYDMALLMKYALKNEMFKQIIGTKSYTVKTPGKTYLWKNKNKLLSTYDKLIGGKTGFTKKARRTLVTSAMSDNKLSIVVTLNDGNDFQDHEDLHEKVFKNYENYVVVSPQTIIEPNDEEKYYIKDTFSILVTEEEKKDISVDMQIENENNLEAGQAIIKFQNKEMGRVKIYQRKEEIKEEEPNFLVKFFRWLFKW